MINVSSAERAEFVLWLRAQGVPEKLMAPYVRWVVFYLDFCHKYHFALNRDESLTNFLRKLNDKRQTKEQQQQASQAIAFYRGLKFPEEGIVGVAQGALAYASETLPSPMVSDEPVSPLIYPPPLADPAPTTNAVDLKIPPTLAPSKRMEGVEALRRETSESTALTGASWKSEFGALADEIRLRHYSPKTLQTYRVWMRKFQAFTRSKPPELLTPVDVKEFLTWLAVKQGVSASTQNQAFNALLFVYRHVLHKEFGKVEGVVRAKRKPYIPVVLSRDEVSEVISHLDPPYDLVVKLLYGCGLRLAECLHLRVQCLNFDAEVITIHDGKGQKDRTVPLPAKLVPELRTHLRSLKALHAKDLERNYAGVFLVNALEKKYPKAAREFIWQWLFPAPQLTKVPLTEDHRRYYLHETKVQKAIKLAVDQAGLCKRATAHTFRHSFASHLLQANYDIRTIQELLGHSDVRTTMIYTHTVKSQTIKEARSPLDF